MWTIILAVLGTVIWFYCSTLVGRKIPSKAPNNIHGWGDAIFEDVDKYKLRDIFVGIGVTLIILSILYNVIASVLVTVLLFVIMVLLWWLIRSIRYWLKYKWLLDNSNNKLAGDTGEYYKNHKVELFFDVLICKSKK